MSTFFIYFANRPYIYQIPSTFSQMVKLLIKRNLTSSDIIELHKNIITL